MEYCVKKKLTASQFFTSKRTHLFGIIFTVIIASSTTSYSATQISQFGITWKFDRDRTIGQFANGDYYVVGPVNIISISPASVSSSGRIKNGSMINPIPASSSSRQGYDNSMAGNTYDATLNKAFNVSSGAPLVVQPGSSLVSTISVDAASATPQLKTAAILTVVAAVPPAGSFRPAYAGTDKTIRYNKSQLKYSLLENFAPVTYTPSLATIEQEFERPWIDHRGTAGGRYYHPADNMPDYGRDMSRAIGDAALMLHLNFTDQQKETLLVRFVQLGIDLYGIVAAGGTENWEPDGGHASGRKWPIMFAGLMLGDTKMASIGSIPFDQLYFGEDGQTFYVSQSDVALTSEVTDYKGIRFYGHFNPYSLKEYQEYTTSDIGLPEWGLRHALWPLYDGKDWGNAAYRECCTANVWGGFVLAAHIMGQKDAWNHDALFDYMDRYMAIEAISDYNRQQSQFAESMWDAYRPLYGNIWPNNVSQAPVFDPIGNKTVAETITLTFSVRATSATGATITYSAKNLPAGATFTSRTFTWKPTTSQAGSYNVTFVASDGTSQTTQTITITVTNTATVNQAPVLTPIGNKTVHALSQLAFTLVATDPDGDLITYSATGMPSGAKLTGSAFSWTPTTAQVGTFKITFTASDGKLSSSQQVTITVSAVNRPPVIEAVANQSVSAGTLLSFAVPMSDPDGDPLVRAAMNMPSGASFQNETFQWTPAAAQVGSYTVTFYANDGSLTTTDNVTITVLESSPSDNGIIIDNDQYGTSSTGTWQVSSGSNAYGSNNLWSRDGTQYTWQMNGQPSGTYEVLMYWTSWPSRTTSAAVDIGSSSGTTRKYINQQTGGSNWNSLGTYTFNGSGSVTITASDGDTVSTCADAVWFKPVPPAVPPIIIDNATANTDSTGTWEASSAPNPYGGKSVWGYNGATYTWIFTPPVTGTYRVSMWWTELSTRSDSVPVQIQSRSGTANVFVNQQQDGGMWNNLGQYTFTGGATYEVTITAPKGTPPSTCADAVKFEKL